MRKVISALALIVACGAVNAQVIGGGVGVHNHSSNTQGGTALTPTSLVVPGTLNINTTTGALSSTKACAANFTRLTPNYCARVDNISAVAISGACTAVTLPASDAKALVYYVNINILTNTAVGSRDVAGRWWGDAGCTTTLVGIKQNTVREETAVGPAILYVAADIMVVPVVSGALFESSVISTAGSSMNVQIRGYYD